MSDIIKAEPKETSSIRARRRKESKKEKANIDPVSIPQTEGAIAEVGMEEAAEMLADATLVSAAQRYDVRMRENWERLLNHARTTQRMAGAALKKEIQEVYGLTEKEIYGE